jgi:DNA-binding transcriptional regulator YiaG
LSSYEQPSQPPKKPSPARNPTHEEIRAAREAASLTQTAAAELIHSTLRTWQDWEAGIARMHPGLWELFLVKLKK